MSLSLSGVEDKIMCDIVKVLKQVFCYNNKSGSELGFGIVAQGAKLPAADTSDDS